MAFTMPKCCIILGKGYKRRSPKFVPPNE